MTMIAYAFLQYRRLKTERRKKRFNGSPPPPPLPAVRQAILELNYRSTTAAAMPPLQKMDLQRKAA
jgi:hypothetical protein